MNVAGNCFKPLLFALVLFSSFQGLAASGVSYHGRIIKPNNMPLESATARFRIQIKSPGAESCVLWEEEQTRNMLGSNGTFSITIGDSSDTTINYTRVDSYAWGIERVFSNRSQFNALTGCTVGTTYLPNSADGRILEVSFKEVPTDPTWESFPATKINLIPMALNTLQFEGYRADEFLKIDPYVNQTPLTNASVNTLLGLIAGTSNLYVKPADAMGGDLSGTHGAGTVVGIRGRSITNAVPGVGQVLKFDGTSWVPSADDTGGAPADASYLAKGIVQFDTNLATSGISVTAGVASLPNLGAAGTYGSASNIPVITTDAKGRVTGVVNTAVDDVTKLPLAGGTMTGSINMGLQNITNATSVAATNFSGRNLLLSDNDTNVATIRAPVNLAADYALTLPTAAPVNGYVLSTDAAGQLSWIAAASGSVTGLSSTNLYLTVDSSTPAVPTLTVNVGTVANTVAAGNDARIVGALQSADYLADVTDSTTCLAGEVPYWNTVGDRWMCRAIGLVANATNAVNFSGNLSGDVTGTQGATVVEKIRGVNVVATAPVIGQVLKFDGTNYVPSVDAGLVAETDPNVQAWAKQAPNAVFTTVGNELGLSARVSASVALPAVGQDGQSLRWNNSTSQWEFFTAGAAGAGIGTLNGQTGNSQSFAVGAAGLTPAFNSVADVHTLNIPLASGAGVLSGTISKADYDLFSAKLSTTTNFAGDVSGTFNAISVDSIKGYPVVFGGPLSAGQVLKFNGTSFVAGSDDTNTGDITSVVAGNGLVTGGVTGDVTLDVAAGNGIVVAADSVAVDTGLGANKIPQVGGTALGANGVVVANGTGTALSSLNCLVGQVIKFDASGFAVCGADSDTGLTGFTNGGNSFGAAAVLGTNDNNSLNFETNSTTKMTILANGNVGLGETNPTYELDIRGSSIRLQGYNSNKASTIETSSPGDGVLTMTANNNGDNAVLALRSNNYASIGFNGNERFRVTSAGNVGIGTNAPSSVLDINGAFTQRSMTAPTVAPAGQGRIYFDSIDNQFRVSQNGGAYVDLISGVTSSGTAGHLQFSNGSGGFSSDNNQIFWDATNNRLGIGTNAPTHALDINASSAQITSASGNSTGLYLTNTTTGGRVWEIQSTGDVNAIGAGHLNFYAQGLGSLMTLKDSNGGRVGISNTNPGALLDVGTPGTSLGTMRLSGSTSGYVQIQPAAAAGSWNMTLPANAGTSGQVLSTNGSGVTSWTTVPTNGGTFLAADGTAGAPSFAFTNDSNTGVFSPYAGAIGFSIDGSNLFSIDANALYGGQVYLSPIAASAGQPSYGFNGDDDTGMYSPALGEIRFTSNSSDRMTLLPSGNVGIGTISPSAILDLNANSNQFAITANDTRKQFTINYDILSDVVSMGVEDGYGTQKIAFRNNGQERMRITQDGSVGIGTTIPSSLLDLNGAFTQRSMAAPALAPGGQGRIYFDSTSNRFQVSQNGGAYVDLIPAAGQLGGTGTTNAIPKFTAAGTIGDSAIVDNGTTITATRSIATATNPIATGATVNLATSNTHTLASVGGSAITIQNQSNGGVYNIVIEDTVSRTYTFTGCTSTFFKPANAPTAAGTRTVYGLMTIQKGGNWDCYVTWSTGFQ